MVHVIKISGHELDQPASLAALVETLTAQSGQVVLVHGGGSVLPRALSAIGGPTNGAAAEYASMALRGMDEERMAQIDRAGRSGRKRLGEAGRRCETVGAQCTQG